MRFDTNFIWAHFAPVILISLVSYVSVLHKHAYLENLDLGSEILPLRVERTTVEYQNDGLLRQKAILSTMYICSWLYELYRTTLRGSFHNDGNIVVTS